MSRVKKALIGAIFSALRRFVLSQKYFRCVALFLRKQENGRGVGVHIQTQLTKELRPIFFQKILLK